MVLEDENIEIKRYTEKEDYKPFKQLAQDWLMMELPDSGKLYYGLQFSVVVIAFIARFYKIDYPDQVVFDETHFGMFASYYLERTYFFDLHPPFAKLVLASLGWLIGYDGGFKFEEIGDSYTENDVPYLVYRCFNALLGVFTVSLTFSILKEVNMRAITCLFGALMVAIDNAQILGARLIMLDSILVFNICSSLYCYILFYKCQLKESMTKKWYLYLFLTGFSLSNTISTKYVGVLTYGSIGTAVVANIWQLLDVRAGLTFRLYARNVIRRFNGLVVAPFVIYIFWFWVHFTILTYSGPDDSFMSEKFQDTLISTEQYNYKSVNYYDIVNLNHAETEVFLYSDLERYPSYYEDGRISSGGQQVCGTDESTSSNDWEILPVDDTKKNYNGAAVILNDCIRLRHVDTGSFLLTHDVASPLSPITAEVTTINENEIDDETFAETVFCLESLREDDVGSVIKTNRTFFAIVSKQYEFSIYARPNGLLPEWGHDRHEICGTKMANSNEKIWEITTIKNLDEKRRALIENKIVPQSFFSKWAELQILMFSHNNDLTSEHDYASNPYTWPQSLNGVLYWTNGDKMQQIYFIGNILGWWIQSSSLFLYIILVIFDLLTRRRQVYVLNYSTRQRIYGPLMFFFTSWCWHYFPFYLMSRQKFLHHYLPAHLIASLFTATFWETVASNMKSNDYMTDKKSLDSRLKRSKYIIILSGFIVSMTWCFFYFAPITYGTVSLTQEEICEREWLNIQLAFCDI